METKGNQSLCQSKFKYPVVVAYMNKPSKVSYQHPRIQIPKKSQETRKDMKDTKKKTTWKLAAMP
jgi:hypothetical protein